MKLLLPWLALAAVGTSLTTDYTEQNFRVETKTRIEMETTSFSMERNGEPVEGRFGGGDRSSEIVRRSVLEDHVLESRDGRPLVVRRTFAELESSTSMQFGDNYNESEADCPLAETTLELRAVDGDVEVEVVDGDEPDDALLEGHQPTLALDALLPDDEVEPGDSWELDQDAILRALGLDVAAALFPAPVREEQDDGGRGGRGRGGRGFGGGRRGASAYFTSSEWEGTATLAEDTEEMDGVTCNVIELVLKAEGELPEPEFGGGGRRGRAFSPPASLRFVDNLHEIELEGRLYFSVEEARPVALALEGTIHQESEIERSRGDMSMHITSSQDGTFEHEVHVTKMASEEDDE